MSNHIVHKAIKYKYFYLHFLSYKQLETKNIEPCLDEVYKEIFEHNIEIINCKLILPKPLLGKYKKMMKKVFGETNWMHNELFVDEKEKLSGIFIGVSGCLVKTLLTDTSIIKLVISERPSISPSKAS